MFRVCLESISSFLFSENFAKLKMENARSCKLSNENER